MFMFIKQKPLISILCIFICNNMNSFATENNISSGSTSSNSLYNVISNNNENKKQSQEIELTNINYKDIDTLLSISDCEQLEKIIQEICNFNIYNKDGSEFALSLAKELTQYAKNLKQYKSIWYAINCYKKLTHLMYVIGKDQSYTDGDSVNVGMTIKLHGTGQQHITYNKQNESKLYKCIDKFIPFYNYFLNEIYPKIFNRLIRTQELLDLGTTLGKKSNERTYINTSLLPQVKYLISKANEVNKHVTLLETNIKLFKKYLNEVVKSIKNYWISNENVNEEIINLINMLENSVSDSKNNEVDTSMCENLVNKIRNQINKIDSKQWSYAYSLSKELPVLATRINRSKNIIIESNFSFAHNLDYLIKLIEADKISNDYTYNQQINSILEELKHFDYLD